jgi:phosphoribosylglycinamide formyltransferase 1
MIQLAIFASGAGSNALRIIEHFKGHQEIKVALVVCNKPGAGVITIAEEAGIPVLMIEKEQFMRGDAYTGALRARGIDFIVLAGFLWKIPPALVSAFAGKMVNIHPALLPKYGGKGMYGHFVHEAVIAAGDTSSGITIHFVDELYDHGNIIFQASCPVEASDTPATLAHRIHLLEHAHYPAVIEKTLQTVKS